MLDIINGYTSGRSTNSKVLSSIKLLEKELELSMLILLILPKNVIGAVVGILPDTEGSLNVIVVGIPSIPTLMEPEILHDDILGICAGVL